MFTILSKCHAKFNLEYVPSDAAMSIAVAFFFLTAGKVERYCVKAVPQGGNKPTAIRDCNAHARVTTDVRF